MFMSRAWSSHPTLPHDMPKLSCRFSGANLSEVRLRDSEEGCTSSPAGNSRSECSGNQYWVSTPGRLAGMSVKIEDHA